MKIIFEKSHFRVFLFFQNSRKSENSHFYLSSKFPQKREFPFFLLFLFLNKENSPYFSLLKNQNSGFFISILSYICFKNKRCGGKSVNFVGKITVMNKNEIEYEIKMLRIYVGIIAVGVIILALLFISTT